jgi:AraC family transcriptional regulator of adaptative response / DNA-3-methyladenine glycosylase II
MPQSRARALVGLAEALASGEIVIDGGAERDKVEHQLLARPGIGRWTASYVALRALGDPDAFVPADLGVRRALERAGLPGDPAHAAAVAERWRPWRAYALQYLWATAEPPNQTRSTS